MIQVSNASPNAHPCCETNECVYRSQYSIIFKLCMAFSSIFFFPFHNLIFVASTFCSLVHEHVAHWFWCLCVAHRLFVAFRYDLYRACVEPKSKGLCFIYANACANAQCIADIWLLQYDWLLPAFRWSFEFMVNWNIEINNETSFRLQYSRAQRCDYEWDRTGKKLNSAVIYAGNLLHALHFVFICVTQRAMCDHYRIYMHKK